MYNHGRTRTRGANACAFLNEGECKRSQSVLVCGSRNRLLAEGAAEAVWAMLAEQVFHAELYLIDVVFGYVKAMADRLDRLVAEFDTRVDAKVAAGNVLLLAEHLKSLHQCMVAYCTVKLKTLYGRDHAEHILGRTFDVLGVALGGILHVAEKRAGLPMKLPKPVCFGLRLLVAVCLDVLLVHQLMESLLHRVFSVGKAVFAVETGHKGLAELMVQLRPLFVGGESNNSSFIEFHGDILSLIFLFYLTSTIISTI